MGEGDVAITSGFTGDLVILAINGKDIGVGSGDHIVDVAVIVFGSEREGFADIHR